MAKDQINAPRFLSDALAKPLQFSFYPRQLAMLGAAALAGVVMTFSGGVVVGRWYGAAAVETTPTLSALDQQVKPLLAASMPKLSFHEELPKPVAEDPAPEAEPEATPTKPEALDDQAQAMVQQEAKPKKPEAKPAEAKKPEPEVKKVEPKNNLLAAPPKETPKLDAKPEAKKGGSFTLQVGIFSSKKEAEALIKKLKSSGEKPFLGTSDSTGAYIVRIGTYPDLDSAKTGQKAFKNRTNMSAMIAAK